MTLLTTVQDVCAQVGVVRPTSVFSGLNGNRTMQEMLALANEMAQRIAYDTRDWTGLYAGPQVYVGDGVTTHFPLPANFKRLLLTSQVWRSTSSLQPMRFIPDFDEWMQRRTLNYFSPVGEWTLAGGDMAIAPTMGVGITARFVYLDKNCIELASGGFGDRFMADDDIYRQDERILKLGMIWQWKAQKGSPYAEDMANYETALGNIAGRDKPAPIIIDRLPSSWPVRTAYPWPVPTP